MLDNLRAIAQSASVLELRETVVTAFKKIGLSRVFFLSPVGMDRAAGRALINMGFPEAWETSYRDADRLNDPLPDISVRIGHAFHWDALPEDVVLNGAETKYLDSLKDWDMAHGVCVATHGSAARVGFVGASGPTGTASLENVDLILFQIAAQTSYTRYCELITTDLDFKMNLSSRELDVLHWMAQGKSNGAIAEILGVGAETVATYVKRTFAKLGVYDRTSAVMKGVTRGLVIASDPKIDAAILARQQQEAQEE